MVRDGGGVCLRSRRGLGSGNGHKSSAGVCGPESWNTAANGFKNAVSQERWQALVAAARGPLGKLKERSLSKATTTKTLPGAPDWE